MEYGFFSFMVVSVKVEPTRLRVLRRLQTQCRCSSRQIENYRQRISGPLLDSIDLHVEVPLVEYRELSSTHQGKSSDIIRKRVIAARRIQAARFKGKSATTTAESPESGGPKLHVRTCGDGYISAEISSTEANGESGVANGWHNLSEFALPPRVSREH